MRIRTAILLSTVGALLLPGSASARDIHVYPGANNIQEAIDRASSGDVLRIHGGYYNETPMVNKRLTLIGYHARPRIRGLCRERVVVRVRHAGVVLNHLKVVGAAGGFGSFPAEVDFQTGNNGFAISSGKAKDLKLEAKCEGVEYGINVFNTGPVQIVNNIGTGYEDAGIYIGGIQDTHGGTLMADGNEMFGNNRGIIVEDSKAAAVDIAIKNNNLHDNTLAGEGSPDGLFLTNSDHVLIMGNASNLNGAYGFHAANDSDNNVFTGNTASGNGTAPFFAEAGSDGSCSSNNNFSLPACP